MTRAYVVTEGQSDARILKRLLPQAVVEGTEFVVGAGRYSAQSLAATILAVKRRPVALVVDADTEDELAIREQAEFLRELLRQTAAGIPFEVFTAVPEMEAVFFQDKSVVERLIDRKFEDQEWVIAKHQPKRSLGLALGQQPLVIEELLGDLPPESVHVLQQHPLVGQLSRFLASTTTPVA